MFVPTFNDARVRKFNSAPTRATGAYVLYWCQMARRLRANAALDYAITVANSLKKPLVVYEALKLNYPWASARVHQFMLEGMRDNARTAAEMGLNYWPFVETPEEKGRGLVKALLQNAVAVVTDDYPAYMTPAHNRALAAKADVALFGVDGCGIVPMSLLGPTVGAAAHLRPRWHKLFGEAWTHRAAMEPTLPKAMQAKVNSPFTPWNADEDIAQFVAKTGVDATVPAVPNVVGGATVGRTLLETFVRNKLKQYAEDRSKPDDPERNAGSGLSPYLHFGHVGIQEVCERVLGAGWTTEKLNLKTRNKDNYFCDDANINGFLDEAITWRDLGHHWHWNRNQLPGAIGTVSWEESRTPTFNFVTMDFSKRTSGTLETVLPEWAKKTLGQHEGDRREFLYTLEQFEEAQTHDELWNAAQKELVATGKIHNYLRMLWAKKVLQWSATPEDAYITLEYLNNKYALDGRDPNSYSGILWCFGLFDRPWAPQREVFGSIRYMSSDNTGRKFKLAGYYEYVKRLPSVKQVKAGQTSVRPAGLFSV